MKSAEAKATIAISANAINQASASMKMPVTIPISIGNSNLKKGILVQTTILNDWVFSSKFKR